MRRVEDEPRPSRHPAGESRTLEAATLSPMLAGERSPCAGVAGVRHGVARAVDGVAE
jgi:hypothetical protein